MGQNGTSKLAETANRGCFRTVLQYIASPAKHFLDIYIKMMNDHHLLWTNLLFVTIKIKW